MKLYQDPRGRFFLVMQSDNHMSGVPVAIPSVSFKEFVDFCVNLGSEKSEILDLLDLRNTPEEQKEKALKMSEQRKKTDSPKKTHSDRKKV